jgi:hypothetical protein
MTRPARPRSGAPPELMEEPMPHQLLWAATSLALRVVARLPATRRDRRDERGDVNGYVFITLMTAGVVMVIWVIARDRLAEVFDRAISSVVGP